MLAYICLVEKSQVIFEAVGQLMKGNLILCPADNFWGVCCDASQESAVQKMIDLSEYDKSSQLTILLNSDAMVNNCVKEIPGIIWDLLDLHTEPLNLIMEGGLYVAKNALADDGSICFRLIKTGIAAEIMQKTRKPLVFYSGRFKDEKPSINPDDLNSQFKASSGFIVPSKFASSLSGKAEKIIRIQENGEINILRK